MSCVVNESGRGEAFESSGSGKHRRQCRARTGHGTCIWCVRNHSVIFGNILYVRFSTLRTTVVLDIWQVLLLLDQGNSLRTLLSSEIVVTGITWQDYD